VTVRLALIAPQPRHTHRRPAPRFACCARATASARSKYASRFRRIRLRCQERDSYDPVRLPLMPPPESDVEAATLAQNGSPLITRITFPTCRAQYPGGSKRGAVRHRSRSQFRGAAVPGRAAMCYGYSEVANRSAVPASCRALSEGMGGFDYAACEAYFEAKAHEGSLTGVGSRWDVFVTGGRRIRSNR
jgi:hypothetical protein